MILQSLKKQYAGNALKTIGIYTVTNFFVKGSSFLLLPVFTDTRYMSPADNGLLSLFAQAITFLVPFVSLGILQSASVDYFKLDKQQFKDFCTTGIVMSAVVTLVSMLGFLAFGDLLYTYFRFPLHFFWIIPLITFFTFCFELLVLIVRNRGNAFHYMRINFSKMLLDLLPAVVLIVAFAFAWKGRVASAFLSAAVIAGYALWYFWKNDMLFGKVRMSIIKKELKYSLPAMAMQFSIFCLFSSDSFLLAGITHDHAAVGIYGMACLFGSIMLTLTTALLQYFVPKINGLLSQSVVDHEAIKKQFFMYCGYLIIGFLLLICAIPVAYKIFIDEAYAPGLSYYIYLTAGYLVWSFTYFFYVFLLYHKAKARLFFISAFAIVISICSNYIFIKNWSAMGAAVSVLCSYVVVFGVTLGVTWRYWKMWIKDSIAS